MTQSKDSFLNLKNISKFSLLSLPNLNSFLIGLLLIFLLNPNISFFFFTLSLTKVKLLSLLLFITLIFSLIKSKFKIAPLGGALLLVFFFFTDTLNKPYNLLQGPIIKGEILLFTLCFFILFGIKKSSFIYKTLLFSPILLASIFIYEGSNALIWSDDNPTFLYRLEALKRFFPNIPFYYTGWNSGLDARDFFATGALNVFFLAYPLIKLLDLTKYYNFIVAYLLFFILPLSIALSCKILKKDFKFTSICVSLSVANSLFWYRWALKYGTLGFITSASLCPLVFVLASKLLSRKEELSKKEAILLIISTSLLLLWSAAGLVFIPTILFALFFIKRVFKKKYSLKIVLSLMLINLPWITIFWKASNVSSFLTQEKAQTTQSKILKAPLNSTQNSLTEKKDFKTKVSKISLEKTIKNFKETTNAINPIIYLFSSFGIFLLCGTFRTLFILTFSWLIFLASVVSQIKPQMEFDRMLIILGILCIFPVAKCITLILENGYNKKLNLLKSFILAFIFTSILSVGSILKNRSIETYYHQNDSVKNLIKFLKNYNAKGRVLFSGFVLHDFGHGHIAPLPFLTGKQIIASSPFHNVWKYTEVIPKEFLTQVVLVKKYLELENVELIIAHERNWRDYFSKDSDFTEIYKFDNYKIFKYDKFSNSFLLSGSANNIHINETNITLTPTSKEIILKFNYFPFLTTNNCIITNNKISDSINFIKLSDCKLNVKTTIVAKNAILRTLGK